MSSENYERLGSVIVDLGNNFATTEADIVSMATRLSSTGAIVGLSESQIMAIATALSSVGIEAEAGGSAISKLLKQFETMVATGSPKLEDFAAVAGMSADEFSQKWGEDAVGALSLFIDGLGQIDDAGGSSIAVLDELGITEDRLSNAVTSLASSHGILEKALKTADSAWKNNTALAKEAATRYETTESKLQMLSNACNNVKTAIGDKLTPAVGNLATAGTDVLTWTADMIDNSTLLVPVITSVATSIGVLAAGISGYTVVTKVAAAATKLFNAVLDANKFFLVGTAVASLAAGIGVLVATLKDDAIPSVEELTTAAQELPKAFEEANATYEESETKILATSAVVDDYIARLRELEAQGTLTTEQQDEYAQIIDKLRYLLPEINIELDAQTGLAIGGAEAIADLANSWKEVALQEALLKKYRTEVEKFADAEFEVYLNKTKLNDAETDEKILKQELTNIQQAMTDNYAEQQAVMEDSTLTAQEQTQKVLELEGAWNNLFDEMVETQGQIDQNTKSQENLKKAISEGEKVATGYADTVDEAQRAIKLYEEETNKAAEGTNGLSGSMAENQQAVQDLQGEIEALAQSYKDAYDSAYESISGQIGLFDDFAAEVSEDTDTVEKMMDRWAKQTENLASYTENLKKAAEYGLDDGLIASLSDGSTESAGYLATIISHIEELGGSTENMSAEADGFVTEFNAAFARTEEAKESFATTVAAIETNLDEAVQQLEEKAAAVDFSGFSEALNSAFENVGANFQSIGIDCGTGLAQGLNDSQGQVREAGVAVGDAAEDGTRDGVESHSPSQAFFRIGEDCDSGLEQGIKSKIPNILATAKDMGQQLTTRMKESGKQAVEGYDREFSQISAKSASACRSMVSSASSAASGLPGAMTDIGVQSVNGMINGMYSRSSALYSAVNSIVSTAIARARTAAAVRSPSRKTMEIFENVGEGMVVGLENKREKVAKTAQSVVEDALKLEIGTLKMPDIDDSLPNVDAHDTSATATNETKIENHWHIESMSVREEADIRKVAAQLYRLQQSDARSRGMNI